MVKPSDQIFYFGAVFDKNANAYVAQALFHPDLFTFSPGKSTDDLRNQIKDMVDGWLEENPGSERNAGINIAYEEVESALLAFVAQLVEDYKAESALEAIADAEDLPNSTQISAMLLTIRVSDLENEKNIKPFQATLQPVFSISLQ
jgi:DNA-binding protein Fis